jgi:hypothetical protein
MRYRFFRVLSLFFQRTLSVVVRAFVTTLVFGMCVVVLMRCLGMPLPSASQLWQGIEGLSRLAKVLS